MANCPRYENAGRITNYELDGLRQLPGYGKKRFTQWSLIWSSLSNDFHPTSLADWKEHTDNGHGECEYRG